MPVARHLAMAALLGALAGCASYPQAQFTPGTPAVAVQDTPFYAQERYQCGPAALQTLLDASGTDSTLDGLVGRVYLPGREGSLQPELLAATRAYDRIPYRIDPTLDAVAAELAAGRPVLVLQNLGVTWLPRWHYAVVFAVDPDRDLVRLRSGTDADRQTPVDLFLKTWARSGFWGFVALRPGELPARVDQARYFDALAAMEGTGHAAAVLPSWRAAADRWPSAALPPFALGNAALGAGDRAAAEAYFRRVLGIDPAYAPAINNLAWLLGQTGRHDEAVAMLDRALASTALATGWRSELEDTRTRLVTDAGP